MMAIFHYILQTILTLARVFPITFNFFEENSNLIFFSTHFYLKYIPNMKNVLKQVFLFMF